jgi:hypothetical protein
VAGAIAVVVWAVILLVPAVALVIGGVAVRRRTGSVEGRVAVQARVVEHSAFRRPPVVVFDYPAPDGSWLRAQRAVGIGAAAPTGWNVQPGTPMTVWVDPRNPVDVRLEGTRGAGGLGGVVMIVVGVVLGGFALLMGAVLTAVAMR